MASSERERRRAPRARAEFQIHLNPKEGAQPATLKDLSIIGLCCSTAHKMAELALVGIDLQLPGQSGNHSVKGAVVRCDPEQGKPGKYEVAVFFTEISPASKAAVAAYVASAAPA
ncbi:hypothetical protein LBMAG49_19570 [Planctomycetota bacterium]|jgi:hypothetical protein|nr:PilZ domain-containing protein [Planctomycetota bacterium]MSR37391.1 PilZ domain-containing protein [Planctomycetota bacterium]GDY02628.1 hypothetical protein LBMAG49_19570 [Planctomycetota bacterium]